MVGKTVTVVASDVIVRIVNDAVEVASHRRSWTRKGVIEDPRHRAALIAQKAAAKPTKRREQLQETFPAFGVVVDRWLDENRNIGAAVARCYVIYGLYGDDVFAAGVDELIARDLADPSSLEALCEDIRRRLSPRTVQADPPSHPSDRDVVAHDLESYDDNRRRR